MFTCLFCGLSNPSEKARFCNECGPNSPSKDWLPDEIDQPDKVTQYVSMLSEFYFDAQDISEVEKFSIRLRQRLKISFDTHQSVLEKLAQQKKSIEHLANFRFEFNENVLDAYAGHDTFLNFRYTNLSEDDLFKVSLFWDDPTTSDRVDLKAETKSFIKPLTSVTIGASAIFDRIGIKELSDLQITITDQFGESANFRAEPFSFKVGKHDQMVTNNISTHNQISIEGRGVVDASGMGTDKVTTREATNSQPKWIELKFSYLPTSDLDIKVEPKKNLVEFNEDDPASVIKAAELGNAAAQSYLGFMYSQGKGVAQDYEKFVHWTRLAAEQGDLRGQGNLGVAYRDGIGVAADSEKAVYWFRLSAEQGLAQQII